MTLCPLADNGDDDGDDGDDGDDSDGDGDGDGVKTDDLTIFSLRVDHTSISLIIQVNRGGT
jgi:hypothetical protein